MVNDLAIRFVVATRANREYFFSDTATGRSLRMYEGLGFELDLYDSNSHGLPVIYNKSIRESIHRPAILIFTHDDVHFLDFWWIKRIRESLKLFDIVGIAGNTRRLPFQPTWCHKDCHMKLDHGYMSGAIGLGTSFPPSMLCVYGPTPQKVMLIDGVFIACHSEKLLTNNILFDERFDFHYYDLDLCRQAEFSGLSIGTTEIALLHESGGHDNENWRLSQKKYFEKWGS